MEVKSLAISLKRSLSWSVNAKFAGHEDSAGFIRSHHRNTKEAEDTALKDRGKGVHQLIDEALKKGSKYELDMSGLLAGELQHSRAVDSCSTTVVFPEAVKELKWLTRLDVSGNRLVELPVSLGELAKLTILVVSENELVALPKSIGKLKDLAVLSMEKNRIEELPWGIGQCKALTQINGDYNNLKSLPDTIGRLGNLKSLSVRLNCLKSLPKSMASMSSLVELDLRFNHLEDIPENLCLVTSLVRLNLASNFSALKLLPESIGRLQNLRELDVSFNNLTSLPDSFALLTNLQALHLEGNPLLLPPLQIAEQGKEVVLSFMINYVEKERCMMRRRKRCPFAKLVYKLSRMFRRRNGRVNYGDLHKILPTSSR